MPHINALPAARCVHLSRRTTRCDRNASQSHEPRQDNRRLASPTSAQHDRSNTNSEITRQRTSRPDRARQICFGGGKSIPGAPNLSRGRQIRGGRAVPARGAPNLRQARQIRSRRAKSGRGAPNPRRARRPRTGRAKSEAGAPNLRQARQIWARRAKSIPGAANLFRGRQTFRERTITASGVAGMRDAERATPDGPCQVAAP